MYMENPIQEATRRVREVIELLRKYVAQGQLTLEDTEELLKFYKAYRQTNMLADYATSVVVDSTDNLYSDAQNLQVELSKYYAFESANTTSLLMFDTEKVCDEYLRLYKETWEVASAKYHKLEKEYGVMDALWNEKQGSARQSLTATVNAKQKDRDDALREAQQLRLALSQAETRTIPIRVFGLDYFSLAVDNLDVIAKAIAHEIDTLRKEGRL